METKFWAGNSCYVLNINNKDLLDFEYLYYYMKSIQSKLTETQMVGAIPAVNMGFVKDLVIRYPEQIEDQRKLAQVLKDLDELAHLHASKVDTLTKMKSQLMSNKSGIIETERQKSETSAGWVKVKLGDVFEVNPRGNIPEQFLYMDLECVKSGKIVKDMELLNREQAPSRAKRTVANGDICFQTVRPYQRNNILFYNNSETPVIVSTGYAVLRPVKCESKLLYYVIQTDEFVKEVMNRCTGGAYPTINSSDLASIEVCIPSSLEEQQRIASILENYDGLIESQSQLIQIVEREREFTTAIAHSLINKLAENG